MPHVPTVKLPFRAPSLLAVGPWNRAEFLAVRDKLDPHGCWPTVGSLIDAMDSAADFEVPPELILLAQPRPGLDDQSDIERLGRDWPLTRIIVVAGAWCEGELRTGRPHSGVIRLYWHEFPSWWRTALSDFAENRTPSWSNPLTASATSICAAGCSPSGGPQVHTIRANLSILAIDSRDYAAFEAIEQAVAPDGWQSFWQPRHRPELASSSADNLPTAAVWDGAQLDADGLQALRQFCALLAPTPTIALLDFPRPEHIDRAHSAGAASVLGKPYAVRALLNELSRIADLRPSAPIG
jgi:hypothetical protein